MSIYLFLLLPTVYITPMSQKIKNKTNKKPLKTYSSNSVCQSNKSILLRCHESQVVLRFSINSMHVV